MLAQNTVIAPWVGSFFALRPPQRAVCTASRSATCTRCSEMRRSHATSRSIIPKSARSSPRTVRQRRWCHRPRSVRAPRGPAPDARRRGLPAAAKKTDVRADRAWHDARIGGLRPTRRLRGPSAPSNDLTEPDRQFDAGTPAPMVDESASSRTPRMDTVSVSTNGNQLQGPRRVGAARSIKATNRPCGLQQPQSSSPAAGM